MKIATEQMTFIVLNFAAGGASINAGIGAGATTPERAGHADAVDTGAADARHKIYQNQYCIYAQAFHRLRLYEDDDVTVRAFREVAVVRRALGSFYPITGPPGRFKVVASRMTTLTF